LQQHELLQLQQDSDGSSVPTNDEIKALETEISNQAKVDNWDDFTRLKKLTLFRHINRPLSQEIYQMGIDRGSTEGYEAGYSYGYNEQPSQPNEPTIDSLNARAGASSDSRLEQAMHINAQTNVS
jgi:hypothetical protein